MLKIYDKYALKGEKRFEKALKKLFKGQAKRIAEAFKSFTGDIDLIDWSQEAVTFFDTLKDVYQLNIDLIIDRFNITYDPREKLVPGVIREDYNNWVDMYGANNIAQVTETTKKRVRGIVSRGIEEGLGVSEIADNIEAEIENFGEARSRVIARTEVHSSMMSGEQVAAEQAGFTKKVWISSRDEAVRGQKPTDLADHFTLDGETRLINELYSNGLMYPGDQRGTAAQVVNCRCVQKFE